MVDAMTCGFGKSLGKGGSVPLSLPLQRILLLIVMLSSLAACDGNGKPSPPPVPAVAIVNGQSIDFKEFEKALGEETALAKREVPLKREETENLKEEVLDNMIRERIMIQRARDLFLSIGEAELDARMEEIRKDYSDQFDKLFSEGGISLPEWREALRKRMLLEKLIARDVNAKIRVVDEEADRSSRPRPGGGDPEKIEGRRGFW
jgi:hypothetical protein